MAVGDYIVDRYVEIVGVEFVKQLEVVAYTYSGGARTTEQAVVVSLATAYAVAVAVVGYGGHDDEVYVVDIDSVVAVGLLDAERA